MGLGLGSNRRKEKPRQVCVQMISKVYDDLETKDMSKEAFVNECLGVMGDKVKKKSNLILPEGF
jgi:hypothetical protein